MQGWFCVRFDVMTRILGWLLVSCGVFVGALVLVLAVVMFGWDFWRDSEKFELPARLLALASLPQIACGSLCLHYAGLIGGYVKGGAALPPDAPKLHLVLRLSLMLCGLWLTGILGLMSMGVPKSIGTLAIAGLMVTGLGIAGPLRMAQWSRIPQ